MRQSITATIASLEAHRLDLAHRSIASLFKDDPNRFDSFSARMDDLLFDYSKHGLDSHALALLLRLAGDAGLAEHRAALFAGEKINLTEGRAVMHMALRNLSEKPVQVDGRDVMPDVRAVREAFLTFA
ncbi:MAG: glucose-6-phosphate isomerase, partial [Hyphomicrobiales bacterium]|nr:glucose-6-phosphate isomerase [Hyphomicrobiales bacterium]